MDSGPSRHPAGRRRETGMGNVGRNVVETFLAGLNATGSESPPDVGKLLGVRQDLVFGEPVTVGHYTVITAAEVATDRGLEPGSGILQPRRLLASAVIRGLGGGGARGRPVAVVVIGPDGVRVRPIVDATRVALAGVVASTVIGLAGYATWWAVARAGAGSDRPARLRR
ncbi:MAG TPA: hypothetical protein VMU89_02645 [Thermomicrobiaceae bacterium]|nr:hypothetical protein [Thermomicrobiaceae bacterium]